MRKIGEGIPSADRIGTKCNADGRLLLRFNDWRFRDPFHAQEMSDGTLKALAYLLMLEAPLPPTFIGIKEPGNGLHHKLLEILVGEFRTRATSSRKSTQILVSTHQPHLVDALRPEEVWMLEKGEDGFSTIRRASENEAVRELVCNAGLPLGGLWHSGDLD